jgi:hypothetical protein
MCKITEKMVKEMLMWKLEQDELLYEDQSGLGGDVPQPTKPFHPGKVDF